MKIGYRTIKTAIGTPVSISIAQLFGLTNYVSAGILTILCIQPSRKRSFYSAWHRFLACMIASVYALVFFELLGYQPLVLGLMLILFIPTTVLFKITPGISTSSVVTLNLYSSSNITFATLIDQFLLIIVGIGTGLLLNLYMPSLDKNLKAKQQKLEHNFSVILYEYSRYLRYKDISWKGSEITESEDILQEAIRLVERDRENHLLRNKHPYRDYFRMRATQLELFKKMLPLVTNLPNTNLISEKIADFFEKLSNSVHPGNTAVIFLDELKELRKEFNQVDLPTTQEEFETRANLFQLLHEMEDYLLIKKKFKDSDVKHSKSKKQIKTGS
ncbi:aromatic acid exporter family protein [Oceanobacillus damuensis]|uniref:aromatic acid exporter family protein n=1 Tax=Oceanobacillus damuensis TaxID=937928 RepID=UPI000A05F3BB|nr:aromatic acid exporter family protein [Oceanobacillus damuensis]